MFDTRPEDAELGERQTLSWAFTDFPPRSFTENHRWIEDADLTRLVQALATSHSLKQELVHDWKVVFKLAHLKTHPILQPILEFVCQPLGDERSGVEAHDPACRQEPNTTSCKSFPTAADEVRILGDVYDTLQLGDLPGGWVGSLHVRGCTSYRAAGYHVRHRYSYHYYRDKLAALNISFQLTAKKFCIYLQYIYCSKSGLFGQYTHLFNPLTFLGGVKHLQQVRPKLDFIIWETMVHLKNWIILLN